MIIREHLLWTRGKFFCSIYGIGHDLLKRLVIY